MFINSIILMRSLLSKIIIISSPILFLILVLTGNLKSDEEKILEYLQERYCEEFTVIDTDSSSYGGPVFSYNLTADCCPVNHPEYLFAAKITHGGTSEAYISDLYAQGILNKRTADMVKEKIGDFFPDYFVMVELPESTDIVLSDMEEITYESYFQSRAPEYPEKTNELPEATYYITVNTDSYISVPYDKEYDMLFGLLEELSEELHIDGRIRLEYVPNNLYERYTEWRSEHLYAMPSSYYYSNYDDYDEKKKYPYELYVIDYDNTEQKLTSFWSDREPMTKELYVNGRTEKQAEYEK